MQDKTNLMVVSMLHLLIMNYNKNRELSLEKIRTHNYMKWKNHSMEELLRRKGNKKNNYLIHRIHPMHFIIC